MVSFETFSTLGGISILAALCTADGVDLLAVLRRGDAPLSFLRMGSAKHAQLGTALRCSSPNEVGVVLVLQGILEFIQTLRAMAKGVTA